MSRDFGITAPITRAAFWELHDGLVREGAPQADHYALHRAYFGAYVKAFHVPVITALVPSCRAAIQAGDEHMNSPYTQLRHWDAAQYITRGNPFLQSALKENGEGWSLSVNICLLKEAMRQHLEAAEG